MSTAAATVSRFVKACSNAEAPRRLHQFSWSPLESNRLVDTSAQAPKPWHVAMFAQTGERISDYEVLKLLGRGSFGVVSLSETGSDELFVQHNGAVSFTWRPWSFQFLHFPSFSIIFHPARSSTRSVDNRPIRPKKRLKTSNICLASLLRDEHPSWQGVWPGFQKSTLSLAREARSFSWPGDHNRTGRLLRQRTDQRSTD